MVKIFPHNDKPATDYYDSFPLVPAESKAALFRYLHSFDKGKHTNMTALRSLVKTFGNPTGGSNYTDPNLYALLTRINRTDLYVVVLYGIHTSNSETNAHITIQRSCDTSEAGWNDLCHFYVQFNDKGKVFQWDSSKPPTWWMSSTKAKELADGKQLL